MVSVSKEPEDVAQIHKLPQKPSKNQFVCVPLGVTPPCECDPPCMTEELRSKKKDKPRNQEPSDSEKNTGFCMNVICFLSVTSVIMAFGSLAVISMIEFSKHLDD